jgi:hypothetical protein
MSKVNVFITVDTEHSIGGAFRDRRLKPVSNERRIFYRVGRKDYGIALIMDIGERYGLPICFFLEILNKYYFGEEESRSVCQYILGRGHDVQLHLHPNYLNFTTPDPMKREFSDLMYNYPLEKQIEFLTDGRETLIKYGAPNVIAFRAGNFGADYNTLTALEKAGFLVDSSYNKTFLGGDCRLEKVLLCEDEENKDCRLKELDIYDAEKIENIWEFPITNFSELNFKGGRRYRHLDINGVSFAQMRRVLDEAVESGPRNITIVMHSFSFTNPADVQYRKILPRTVVIRRFEKLCRYLAEHNNKFQVLTFKDMSRATLDKMQGKSLHHLPKLDIVLSMGRVIEQAWDLLPKQGYLSCNENFIKQ